MAVSGVRGGRYTKNPRSAGQLYVRIFLVMSPLRNDVFEKFGRNAFEHGLFYKYQDAIRFELSTEGSYMDMFLEAMSKAEQIVNDIFTFSNDLQVCISSYYSYSPFELRTVLQELKDCEISIPDERDYWISPNPEPDEPYRAFLIFSISKSDIRKLIWGAVAMDLGIKPTIRGSVYIYSLMKGVLAHPYDDRGMDIIGNTAILSGLYRKYNEFLLDYDREAMDASFGNIP
ncbi:DUF3885 domain-containing protein [Chromobacterium phragmitis]|nr:DUF3885 domain-containing protein [Chromobacterium amazonense]MBM2884544.1 DUF3885 domain-containing protein [Chromobacterium amazonense]